MLFVSLCCDFSSRRDGAAYWSSSSMSAAASHKVSLRRSDRDLREHRPFVGDPSLDCCPSITELTARIFAVNWKGELIEVFDGGEMQHFYETLCLPHVKDGPCQFVADRFVRRSRCVQQYSYAYAIGRPLASDEKYGVDLIRIATGCKCRLHPDRIGGFYSHQQLRPTSANSTKWQDEEQEETTADDERWTINILICRSSTFCWFM